MNRGDAAENTEGKTPAPDASQTHRSRSSTVSKGSVDGRVVYVKQYLFDSPARRDVVCRRTHREVNLLGRLQSLPGFGAHLGRLVVLSASPESAQLVTLAVPGASLQELLLGPLRHGRRPTVLRPLFLAGRWLRRFQSLAVQPGDEARLSLDPDDLAEYCSLRFEKLRAAGEGWPDAGWCRRIEETVRRVVTKSRDSERVRVWSHGDFGPGNLLWDGRVLTPLDFSMAKLDLPLADVSYFIHRLEMLRHQFPWRRWPITRWTTAFLRGYGRPDALESALYAALMIRHYLCRLLALTGRRAGGPLGRLHDVWLRVRCRTQLEVWCKKAEDGTAT